MRNPLLREKGNSRKHGEEDKKPPAGIQDKDLHFLPPALPGWSPGNLPWLIGYINSHPKTLHILLEETLPGEEGHGL